MDKFHITITFPDENTDDTESDITSAFDIIIKHAFKMIYNADNQYLMFKLQQYVKNKDIKDLSFEELWDKILRYIVNTDNIGMSVIIEWTALNCYVDYKGSLSEPIFIPDMHLIYDDAQTYYKISCEKIAA